MTYTYKQCFSEEMLKDAKCIITHLNEMIDKLKDYDFRFFSKTKCKFEMTRYAYHLISDTLSKAGYNYILNEIYHGYGIDGCDRKLMGIPVQFDDFESLSTDPSSLIYYIELRYEYEEPNRVVFDDWVTNPKWFKEQVNAIFGKENAMPEIKKVIFNDPATIVFWKDGTKTVVKCMEGETFDPEKGILVAMYKKKIGDKPNYFKEIKKWAKTYYDILLEVE